MMKLACKDINPSTTCTYESVGETKEEVVADMMAHAKVDHAEDLVGMSDADIVAMMEPKVHN